MTEAPNFNIERRAVLVSKWKTRGLTFAEIDELSKIYDAILHYSHVNGFPLDVVTAAQLGNRLDDYKKNKMFNPLTWPGQLLDPSSPPLQS